MVNRVNDLVISATRGRLLITDRRTDGRTDGSWWDNSQVIIDFATLGSRRGRWPLQLKVCTGDVRCTSIWFLHYLYCCSE